MERLQIIHFAGITAILTVLALVEAPQTFAQSAYCQTCGGDCSCSGCVAGCGLFAESLCTRSQLFGDWLGVRSGLAEHGIVPNIYQTNFYQGVASGGHEQNFKYGGKVDFEFTFLGEKLGLNKGLMAAMHAETRYGEDVNADAGALGFPNTAMLFPYPEENITSISGLYIIQTLSDRVALTVGKYRTLDLFNMVYPDAHMRGIDGFMNLSMMLPVTLFRTTALSINTAGILLMKEKQVQSGLLVYDTKNVSTTAVPDLFGDGAIVLGYHRFFTELGGLPGSHGFLGNWSSRTYTSIDPWSWGVVPGEGLVAEQETGSWSLVYFLDQLVWADCSNEKRNLRLFSVWSLADEDTNPYRWTGNVSLQGSGLICGRESDTLGVGYFYDGLSSGFKELVSALPTADLQDVQGCELYYNASITPWFHLTADLQIVDNQNVADNTAVIFGLRAKLDL